MRSVKTLLPVFLLLLAAALPASATEGVYFSISGSVTDANWNPIPGALVTLYDNDFNRITTQDTNAQGYFAFEGVSVRSNLCNIRIAYTDADGVVHDLPGYYMPSYTASGNILIDPDQTHFDFYTLPGSVPRATPTPMPTAIVEPTALPTVAPGNGTTDPLVLFSGGFLAGACVAALVCIMAFRLKKP